MKSSVYVDRTQLILRVFVRKRGLLIKQMLQSLLNMMHPHFVKILISIMKYKLKQNVVVFHYNVQVSTFLRLTADGRAHLEIKLVYIANCACA